jgi:hypothetical protein
LHNLNLNEFRQKDLLDEGKSLNASTGQRQTDHSTMYDVATKNQENFGKNRILPRANIFDQQESNARNKMVL